MDEKKLEPLFDSINNLLQYKIEITQALDELMNQIISLEHASTNSNINWGNVLRDLKSQVNSLDVSSSMSFIDDIEESLNDIPYRQKLSEQRQRMAINPIFKHVPMTIEPTESTPFINTQNISENFK